MLISNLRITMGHLSRQRINTAMHIFGLTLGLTVCLLIGLFLRYEFSFDRYHEKADRIYRVISKWSDGGKKVYHYSTPIPMAEALRTGVTGLENITLADPFLAAQIEVSSEKRFIQNNILVADPEILDIFNIEVIAGNGRDVLGKPYYALLTETTAKKLFGKEDPLGKTFRFNTESNFTVGGVIKDFPSNTHLPASMLLSFVSNSRFLGLDPNNWNIIRGNSTFLVLPASTQIDHVEAQLKGIANQYINSDPTLPKGLRCDFKLQRLEDIHFQPEYGGGGPFINAVNTTWLWFFVLIGVLVLALACINFVNLSTAQGLMRAKEIGVRKSLGATRLQLIAQFLTESCMLALIAGVLSIITAQICLPSINAFLDKGIVFNLFQSPGLLSALLMFIFLTGILAGFYPARLIATFNPAANLKPGSVSPSNMGSSMLRKVLVVLQFAISIGLLITVGLIGQQISFIHGKNLGFNKENVVNLSIENGVRSSALVGELNQIPQIKKFSFASGSPIDGSHGGGMISLSDGNAADRVLITTILADDQFCSLYDLKLLAGRLPMASDTNYVSHSVPKEKRIIKVVVNETLIKDLGFESNEAAINSHFWISIGSNDAEIIGIVADFNTNSLHRPINSTVIMQAPAAYQQIGIRIQDNSAIPQAITAIETAWKKIYPDQVFEVEFLDESVEHFYKAEARLYTLFKIFSMLALCISCLGLWGLATLAAQHRTKEVGIRKVLGASAVTIVALMVKEFLSLVAIGLLVATPLAYYFMENWLQNFAFRIDIGWQVFIIAGIVSIAIAFITVFVQTMKVAIANPVDSLRSE